MWIHWMKTLFKMNKISTIWVLINHTQQWREWFTRSHSTAEEHPINVAEQQMMKNLNNNLKAEKMELKNFSRQKIISFSESAKTL